MTNAIQRNSKGAIGLLSTLEQLTTAELFEISPLLNYGSSAGLEYDIKALREYVNGLESERTPRELIK